MICSLLLLYARDSEHIKNDLLYQLGGIPSYCICIDDYEFSQHHALKNSEKSRLQIVFFSPGFLNFLECRPEEAYKSFKHLDPMCTVALFCGGLREYDVMCYHTAALTSYNSWPKFEAVGEEGKESGFSPYMLQLIQEVFPAKSSVTRNAIVVPEILSKESNDVYVIFPDVIQDMAEISIHIENSDSIQITPESVNPYVLKFKVPATLLENCQSFSVQIYQSHAIIVERVLRIVQDPLMPRKLSREDSKLKLTSKVIQLEEQLQALSDIVGIPLGDSECNSSDNEFTLLPSEDEVKCSLVDMCKKYGLEELSLFLGEPPPLPRRMLGSKRNFSEEEIYINQNTEIKANVSVARNTCAATIMSSDDGEYTLMSRSMSLPSILPATEEFPDTYGDYLQMVFKNGKMYPSPSTDALNSLNESYMSSNTYISMNLRHSGDTLETAKRAGLSKSQQELLKMMLSFKRGEKTISDVEKQFQVWQQKHCKQSKPPHDNEPEEISKYPFSFFGGWRRPLPKTPNEASDSAKRLSGSSIQSRLSSIENRKSSNTSVSSSSSKASGAKSPHEVSTGWIPAYTSPKVCPLNPEINPPPLPTSPRPSRSKTESKGKTASLRRASTKRKIGTSLAPMLSELLDSRSTDSEDGRREELLESLIPICEKYGLADLGELFVREFCSDKDKSSRTLKDDDLPENEIKDMVNHCLLQLSSSEWDPDTNISYRRSLSLPSTLFPTEAKPNTEKNTDCVINKETLGASLSKYEDYVNSIHSGIYASIKTYIGGEHGQNQIFQALSMSQQELLKLMGAFKRGEKTISQVEQQFQEWQRQHMGGNCSYREKQLLQLREQYERAQKSNTFGIKNFIPRKTKKKSQKVSVADNGKSSSSKSDGDSKRWSRISYTSTSSGVSENGEVFKNVCYFNPGYGDPVQEKVHVPLSSLQCKVPPPLPPRPSLTPVAILRSCYSKSESTDVEEADKGLVESEDPLTPEKMKPNPPPRPALTPIAVLRKRYSKSESGDTMEDTDKGLADSEAPSTPDKLKPNPPPKPPNLFSKVSGFSELNIEKAEEKVSDPETRPESPDYITPNPLRRKMKLHLAAGNDSNSAHCYQCPVLIPHTCAKAIGNAVSSSCPSTMNKSESNSGRKTTAASKQVESSTPKRQIFLIPNPWVKPKKKEESMFYVTRRWSSVPDLQAAERQQPPPIYLELVQVLNESKNRSISDTTSPTLFKGGKLEEVYGQLEGGKLEDVYGRLEEDKLEDSYGQLEESKLEDVHRRLKGDKPEDVHGRLEEDKLRDVHGQLEESKPEDVHGLLKGGKPENVHGRLKRSKAEDDRGRLEEDKLGDVYRQLEESKLEDVYERLKRGKPEDVRGRLKGDKPEDVHGRLEEDKLRDVRGQLEESKPEDVHGRLKGGKPENVHGRLKRSKAEDVRGRLEEDKLGDVYRQLEESKLEDVYERLKGGKPEDVRGRLKNGKPEDLRERLKGGKPEDVYGPLEEDKLEDVYGQLEESKLEDVYERLKGGKSEDVRGRLKGGKSEDVRGRLKGGKSEDVYGRLKGSKSEDVYGRLKGSKSEDVYGRLERGKLDNVYGQLEGGKPEDIYGRLEGGKLEEVYGRLAKKNVKAETFENDDIYGMIGHNK